MPHSTHREIKKRLAELYDELFEHDGYADLHVEIRILKRGQKEVILHCGKQYRYIVDYRRSAEPGPTSAHFQTPADVNTVGPI